MAVVDVVGGVVILAAVVGGVAKGLARAAPLAGFAVGGVVGSRLPLLVGMELDSEFSLVAALPGALVLGAALGALVERSAGRLARFAIKHPRGDRAGGAVVAGAAAVVAVWLLAPVVNELQPARDPIERSDILAGLNGVIRPAGPERPEQLPPIDNLPRFAGRDLPPIEPGDRNIVSDPDVLRAERSVLRLAVVLCDGIGGGSGWMADEGVVVTNAHVVAGSQAIHVQLRGRGPLVPAVPIWFDGDHDVALLRVERLRGVRPLPIVRRPRAGTAGATLGFPLGRRRIWRARIGPTTRRLSGSLGGRESPGVSDDIGGRLVTTIRGRTLPGNSGGPVVDRRGRVLTTAFAGGGLSGSLGVPNQFVFSALERAGPRVSTGRCPGDQ